MSAKNQRVAREESGSPRSCSEKTGSLPRLLWTAFGLNPRSENMARPSHHDDRYCHDAEHFRNEQTRHQEIAAKTE